MIPFIQKQSKLHMTKQSRVTLSLYEDDWLHYIAGKESVIFECSQ